MGEEISFCLFKRSCHRKRSDSFFFDVKNPVQSYMAEEIQTLADGVSFIHS